jgi:hypothetical protein
MGTRPALVPIIHGYRYLGHVQNGWLSTGENAANPKRDRCFSDFLPQGRVLLCGIDFALLPLYAFLYSFSTS